MRRRKKKKNYKPRDGYNSPEYVKWRTAVFTRDRYRCQYPGCKTRSTYVQAHHIKKWANNPNLRYARKNGITLCCKHHKKVNGREQFFERLFITILAFKGKL